MGYQKLTEVPSQKRLLRIRGPLSVDDVVIMVDVEPINLRTLCQVVVSRVMQLGEAIREENMPW